MQLALDLDDLAVALVNGAEAREAYGVPDGETRVIATGSFAGKQETHVYDGAWVAASSAMRASLLRC